MRLRRFRPGWLPLAVVLPLLALGGCKDNRGSLTEPDTGILNGEVLFGSATVSSLFLAFMNQAATAILAIHEAPPPGLTFPIIEQDCSGDPTHTATITENNDSDPNTYRITLGDPATGTPFVIDCETAIPLSFVGSFVIRFLETSPGLDYTISMPFDHATGTPMGLIMQLPQSFGGGAIFDVTTPYDGDPTDVFSEGSIRQTLLGTRAAMDTLASADSLNVRVLQGRGTPMNLRGTLRLEDRGQPILLIEELDIEYRVFRSTDPAMAGLLMFSFWPGGMYEIVGNGGGGVFGPGNIPGYPVEMFFDGFGGARFEFEGNACEMNMITGENPCEQF